MGPSDVQTSPVLVADIIVGVRPRLGGPPLWLTTGPPNDPVFVELLDVGDGGEGVAFVSPVSNFLGAGPQRQPAFGLGRCLVNNCERWATTITYP